MKKLLCVLDIIFCVMLMFVCIPILAEEEKHEKEESQFLFLMEEAYTQEKGEWQFGLSGGYFDNLVEEEDGEKVTEDKWGGVLEVEYGITDRLQVEVEIPYQSIITKEEDEKETESGFGDIEFGPSFALLKETESCPELTIGIELGAPTGDEDKGLGAGAWGFGPSVACSKQLIKDFFCHARIAYGITNNAKEDGEEVDEREFEYGIAGVYRPMENLELILELVGEYEEGKDEEGEKGHANALYIVPGIGYIFELDADFELEVGLGVPIGLTNDSYDWGVIVKVLVEF